MKKKKKIIELNFFTFLIIFVIILAIVFVIARRTGNEANNQNNEEKKVSEETSDSNDKEEYETKLYSKNVITIDEGKLNKKWEIIDKEYGSILFYIQGPQKENEDGTISDIRINIYFQQSEMTNEDLKKQMLEKSIYQEIEYTKMQTINEIQWMEFEGKNKGVKSKILAMMKDGYMYAAEISGAEEIYDENYNDAMRAVMTIQIAERIDIEDAKNLIYKYDNIANIKFGGTQYLLTSLNLPQTIEKTEENSKLPEEYQDYTWTGISYKDFENEMKKYMTEDLLKKEFSEFVNYNDSLIIKEVKGEQTDYIIEDVKVIGITGNETTYEVVKNNMELFMTLREKITVKNDNGKLLISNIEK